MGRGCYLPLQHGDTVEGVTIDYQYVLPSLDNPKVVVAFGRNLLNLIQINKNMSEGFAAYAQEVLKDAGPVLAFDEANPTQSEPQPLTIDAGKPVEIAFIPIGETQRRWSVTESADGEIRSAYKIIRRRDGGLRFVDAYDIVTLQSLTGILTPQGNGTGLGFSARLAQLRLILTDPDYQRGANVMQNKPPDTGKYDPRALKLDPAKPGLSQNVEWVLIAQPAPSTGIPLPGN